jgi:hypothetical protein
VTKLIMALENKPFSEAMNDIKKFTKKEKHGNTKTTKTSMGSNAMVESLITIITGPLCEKDGDYLQRRGFDPNQLKRDYGLLSCKPTTAYTRRILIPYNFHGKQCTFSTRDTTGKAKVKYIHCPANQSILAPKEILYNADTIKDTCVVVEGCFDVFRLGAGTVAISGTQYTRKQVFLLSKFKRIFLLFDPEDAAQKQAVKLANDLSFCSSSIEILKLDVGCDPGDMKEDDVKYLRKEIFGRIY